MAGEDDNKVEAEETPTPEVKAEEVKTEVKEEPAKPRPWFEARIDEITHKRNEALRRAEDAERRVAQAETSLREILNQRKEGDPAPVVSGKTEAQLREEIRREESALAAQRMMESQFTDTCNRIAAAGKAAYRDFDDSIKALQGVEGLTPEMIVAANETDNPESVIYALGKDLDEAMRIKNLPPLRQAVAIAKLAESSKATPKTKRISGAPEPITPINGSAKGDVDLEDDKADIADWIAKRNKQVSDKRKALRA